MSEVTNTSSPIAVVYHAHCLDGFGAAYIAREAFNKDGVYYVDWIPGTYQADKLPDFTDKTVYILDFSYKRDVMEKICQVAKDVIVIDHHASAIADLKGLDDQCDNLTFYFSHQNDQSGAMLAWNYFHANFKGNPENAPFWIRLIQDRDLWQWKYPETKAFTAGLFSLPMTFEAWDACFGKFGYPNPIEELCKVGNTLLRKQDQDIEIIKKSVHRLTIDGYNVPAVNAPGWLASDLGNVLSVGELFAAVYQIQNGFINVSLRSQASDTQALDVSKIASKFGGGGHKNAAGFKVSLEEGVISSLLLTPKTTA